MRIAAYFDLDGTLLSVNTARLWLMHEWDEGRISAWQAMRGVGFLLAYRAGFSDIETATREALVTIAGHEETEIMRWTEKWFGSVVVEHVAPGARPTVEAHRQRGHALVLLTSSTPYMAKLAGELFGLDACLSSRYEVADGRFTGEPLLPLCYGEGKIHHAETHARDHDIDVDGSFFYTDSYTDLPMLERVAHKRIIRPDGRLDRTARKRGWPVIDWSTDEPRILADPDD